MNDTNLSIFGVFSLLSVLAIGGGTAVLPEMKSLVIGGHHWLTDDQFRDIYGLGQIAPGPNMLMVLVVGYHVSGYLGALLAFIGFFLPASLISLGASRLWDHFEGSPWRESLQMGMAPLVIGLMAAGTIAIARTAIEGATTIAVAIVVFLGIWFVKKINPALFILASGAFGFFALQ